MERKLVNPWKWQDAFGFAQAVEVTNGTKTLLCSGQTAIGADGAPLHEGDIAAQAQLALDNLEAVLAEAGYKLADVARLTIYTTDVDALMGAYQPIVERLQKADCLCAQTLLGIDKLAFPSLMIEIEATAMK